MAASFLPRFLSAFVSLAIGAFFGIAATIGHASAPPFGIVIGSIGCAGILVALRMLTEDRAGVIAAGIGMYAGALFISQRGPGGSVVVPQTQLATVWVILLAVIILVVIAFPSRRAFRRPVERETPKASQQ